MATINDVELLALKNSRLKGGFSVSYPNFETEAHWHEQISFLGPPWLQDTKFFEAFHKPQKKIAGPSKSSAN
jgi:hypothetical protein